MDDFLGDLFGLAKEGKVIWDDHPQRKIDSKKQPKERDDGLRSHHSEIYLKGSMASYSAENPSEIGRIQVRIIFHSTPARLLPFYWVLNLFR